MNACLPGVCGAAANGVLDVRAFTAAQGIGAPAATFASVAPMTASAYQNIATAAAAYTVDFRPTGGATSGTALASGAAPLGVVETIDVQALPGTAVAGSGITALIFPRAVANSQGGSATTPAVIFMWDRRPPRTCTLCSAPAR